MTNFQGGAANRFSRETVLRAIPVLLGAVLALMAGQAVLAPVLQRLQADQEKLDALREQRERMPLVRQRLAQLRASLEQERTRQRQLLELIAGSGELNTFMAQLDQEARRSGVRLERFEPIPASGSAAPPTPAPTPAASAATPATPQAPSATPQAPTAPAPAQDPTAVQDPANTTPPPPPPPVRRSTPDPLLVPGLQRMSLFVVARGRGDQLRDFLRRLERLRLLVVQSDLSVKADTSPTGAGLSTLQLMLALYTQEPPAASTP